MIRRLKDGAVAPVGTSSTPSAAPKPEGDTRSWSPKGDLSEPLVAKKHRLEAKWVRADGPLFPAGGVSAKDPLQGSLGDCYFVAAMSALAAAQPKTIENAIKLNADGKFSVTFHPQTPLGLLPHFGKKKSITVNRDMPTINGVTALYAKGKDCIWPMILEKAFAKFDGDYEKLAKGGSPVTIWQAITGKSGWTHLNALESDAGLFEKMRKAFVEHRPLAGATADDEARYAGTGLCEDHLYAVIGVEERDGKRFIRLRNPWGHFEPGQDGNDDGEFEMSFEAYRQQFKYSHIGG